MLQSPWKKVLPLAVTTLMLSTVLASAPALADSTPTELVYIGSQGNQLRAARFDPATGKLSMIGVVAEGLRPTWSVSHPQLPILYVVNDERAKEGSVSAFAVDRASGALSKINEGATGGAGSTHVWLDLPSQALLAANFTAGSTSSVALKSDGSVGAVVSTIAATGTGPHRRQTSAHAHGVTVDPTGRFALVADLGADRLFVYAFDRASNTLTADNTAAPRSVALPPGSGPRHLAFRPDGRFVYLVNELSSDIVAFRWDSGQGRLTQVQSLPLSTPDFKDVKSASEVAVSADGRFVYAGNRAQSQVLVYRSDPDSGELALVQRASAGGEAPWNFALHSSGKWMLVANQRTAKVNVLKVDIATGMLSDSGQAAESVTPVSVTFVK
jgi:6-phosphogluconolactonase